MCVFQCHEASITIYSSMENQRLSHWVFISVVSMIFCLVIYSLTGQISYLSSVFIGSLDSELNGDVGMLNQDSGRIHRHVSIVIGRTLAGLCWYRGSAFLRCRGLWVPDIWKGREGRHSDVVHRRRHSDAHRQAAVWNLHHHHLSHHPAAGQVRSLYLKWIRSNTVTYVTAHLLDFSAWVTMFTEDSILAARFQKHTRSLAPDQWSRTPC